MDAALLEMDHSEQSEDIMESPTEEEAEALLRDDLPLPLDQGDHEASLNIENSPTSAVKAAIDAKISEEMTSEISEFEMTSKMNAILDSKTNATKDSNKATPTPTPTSAPIPKPLPLFPDGLPFPPKTAGKVKSRNDNNVQGKPTSNATAKTTYATKARSPPKTRELVEHILFVYSTWTNKAPINSKDWSLVDAHLLEMELKQNPSDPLIRIANSGYDAAHRCGFIACRDMASAEWCKTAIRKIGGPQFGSKGAFRAWAKGEQPEVRLCRLFLPTRFDSLLDDQAMTLIVKHNPPLHRGTLDLKHVEDVQGGRALFIEFDTDSYSYIKAKGHKIEFPLMDIDCQVYNPPKRVVSSGPGLTGITKLPRPQPPASDKRPAAVSSASSLAAISQPSSSSQVADNSNCLDPRLTKSLSVANVHPSPSSLLGSPSKRGHCDAPDSALNGVKRRTTLGDTVVKEPTNQS